MQQGFFQGFERGELLLVDGFEALGFFAKLVERGNDSLLFGQSREGTSKLLESLTRRC